MIQRLSFIKGYRVKGAVFYNKISNIFQKNFTFLELFEGFFLQHMDLSYGMSDLINELFDKNLSLGRMNCNEYVII